MPSLRSLSRRALLSLRLALLTALLIAPQPARATHQPTLLVSAPGERYGVRTDGETVIWIEGETKPGDLHDVYAASLADRRISIAAGGPAQQNVADISRGIVVWGENRPEALHGESNIVGKDLATGREFTVAATADHESFPVIDGDWVAWLQMERPSTAVPQTIMARNIRSMAPPVVVARVEGVTSGPQIAGNRVVWVEQFSRPDGTPRWRVRLRHLDSGADIALDEGDGAAPSSLAVGGDVAVYTLAIIGRLELVDLRTRERRTLTERRSLATVATDGRYVFWHDDRLYGHDLLAGSAWSLPVGEGRGFDLHLRGGALAWRLLADRAAVHGARISDLLPSARQATPDVTGPQRLFFVETGHSLAFGFKEFWERSGGLAIFGFPLTEEFHQRNPDTDQTHTVQYFERQRFELHSEHRGTPYEVQLGRLGAEEAQQRNLLGTWAFQPVPANAEHPAGCVYVQETQHRLCGEFRPYWEGHGLELGDPGVSYRESLALFGYPISEEFVDPATGLVTQYFERARFEWHPNNRTQYRVLLGRLAADRLAGWGW